MLLHCFIQIGAIKWGSLQIELMALSGANERRWASASRCDSAWKTEQWNREVISGKNGRTEADNFTEFYGVVRVMDRKEIENWRGSEDRFLWPEKKIYKTDAKVALKKETANFKEIDGEPCADCKGKKEWLLSGGQIGREQNKEWLWKKEIKNNALVEE